MRQEYPPEKDTKRSSPAPLRRRLHEFYFGGLSVCRSSSRKQNRPPMYRSGRLQEEQRLVAKTCSFFWRIFLPHCPNFAELESSKEAKSYRENPCNRITGKKSSPRSFRMPLCNLERKQKRPLTGEISPTRGQAKGRCPWKRNVPIHASPSTRSVPIHGVRPLL